jgi:hypothetical protein
MITGLMAHMEAAPRKHGKNALEFRGHLTEGVLVLARNCKDRVLLSPDDAVPEYNFISNLWNELGAQIYQCKLKKKKLRRHAAEHVGKMTAQMPVVMADISPTPHVHISSRVIT